MNYFCSFQYNILLPRDRSVHMPASSTRSASLMIRLIFMLFLICINMLFCKLESMGSVQIMKWVGVCLIVMKLIDPGWAVFVTQFEIISEAPPESVLEPHYSSLPTRVNHELYGAIQFSLLHRPFCVN